jgi:hypothetical protein
MPNAISFCVTHDTIAPGPIQGFRFMWAFYVKGYRPERHCQPGLIGRRVDGFKTNTAVSGKTVLFDRMDDYPYVYVCGVGEGPKSELGRQNLHMPLRYRAGGFEKIHTYNGYLFRADDAELVPIPEPLPHGWHGITNQEHLRCKNFRFAVGAFGEPED